MTTERLNLRDWPTRLRRARSLLATITLLAGVVLVIPTARADDPAVGSAASGDGKVRVEVTSLKRSEGDTVTLRFQLTNNSNGGYTIAMSNVRLIDVPGRRIFSPGVTSSICSAQAGQQSKCYAIFGAPPAGTKTMTVKFYEQFDLIVGVPISE
jgi:hypothetical protein